MCRGEGYFKVRAGQRRLISVFYDESSNNFQIWHPVHIAKFSPSRAGPWSLLETRKTIHRYFPVKLLDWDSVLH